MNKKFVLIITLVIIVSYTTVPHKISVIATEDYGDPDIDHNYVYTKTELLTNITFGHQD